MTKHLLPALVLSLAAPGGAAAIDIDQNQVLIEATLLSVSRHRAIELELTGYEPKQPISGASEAQIAADLAIAAAATQGVIDSIVADAALASSPVGARALDHLRLARAEQDEIEEWLDDDDGPPRAKLLLAPAVLGRQFQSAAISSLQGRPDRFSSGNRAAREVSLVDVALTETSGMLQQLGLPLDPDLFEPFSGGKGKGLLLGSGFVPAMEMRLGVKQGVLEFAALSKEPTTAGIDFVPTLSENFTVVLKLRLGGKRGDKPRDELTNFSTGVKLTSDASSDPAEAFLIEHQTTPAGFVQSFTATKTSVVNVFPHGTASQTREIINFFVKDGDDLTLGALLVDGANTTLVQSEVPLLGELPVLGAYFRNGTKKASVQLDTLLIYLTPQIIQEP